MSIQERIKAREAAAATRGGDLANPTTTAGGGDFKPVVIPEGKKIKARLIGYVELGKQMYFKKENKSGPCFELVFALYGPGYALEDGSPMLIHTQQQLISSNSKAGMVTLFKTMCPNKDATNFIGLLGRAYWLDVVNREGKKVEGKDPVIFNNIVKGSIVPAMRDKFDDNDNVIGQVEVSVPMPDESLFHIFEWDVPSKEDFESIKVNLQKMAIRKALNFAGSTLEALVGGGNTSHTEEPEDDEPEEQQEEQTTETTTEVGNVSAGDLPEL